MVNESAQNGGGMGMDSPRVAVVIEDDKDIRDLVQVVLTQSGFEVYAVDNGADGVAAVRTHDPSVVTLDLGLPDIGGSRSPAGSGCSATATSSCSAPGPKSWTL